MKNRIQHIVALFSLALILPLASIAQQSDLLQYFRPYDQRGLNVFETPKTDSGSFDGFQVYWGAAFTQQFQALDHSNKAAPNVVDGKDKNALIELGNGFNLATANLLLGAQLDDGIQVNLITYLSSRHHSESWVKGGFLQVDKLKMLNSEKIDNLMEYVTLRVGHFEINYGDAHFRRTDNGMAMYNPFIGNLIMDSFATEIGAEVYVQKDGLLGMVGVTGGEIRGNVTSPDSRAPSFYGKVGFDRQVNDDLRVRLTGSVYTTAKSVSNTLYAGDRAGSRFYDVLVNKAGSNFRSGRINPGFRSEVTAVQLNPYVKFQGLEFYGLYETASGQAATEADSRTWDQFAIDAIYRMKSDKVYLGARYNKAEGELAGLDKKVSSNRYEIGGGWFLNPSILLKASVINQSFEDYPETSILHEAEFNGFMLEGVVSF